MTDYLNERCKQHRKEFNDNAWLLHEFINFGADFGLVLYKTGDDEYILKQYADSGYSPETEITKLNGSQVFRLIEGLEPTNPDYRYDS